MKILYAFQGTGKGHLTRAEEIIPVLKGMADTEVLVSGTELNIDTSINIDYHLDGLSFYFGKKGGIDIWKSIRKATPLSLIKDIFTFPVQDYDLVINDFEPVTAWACRWKNVECLGLSHQKAVQDDHSPHPSKESKFGKYVLNYYAKTKEGYGFHFESYNDKIFPPIVKSSIRNSLPQNKGHYTVYLPAYSDKKLIEIFNCIPSAQWHVFSKRAKSDEYHQNVTIYKASAERFDRSMIDSCGVLCGAGFETPSEALHLGKKLLVIPMKGQYEQQCNAAALEKMGVPAIDKLCERTLGILQEWIEQGEQIKKDYSLSAEKVLKMIFERDLAY